MSEIIARVTRGDITECIQKGDTVVVDSCGNILFFCGDPYKESFIRSAAKPLQTLEVFRTGAAARYGFTPRELSIMCASHYGEDSHVETVRGILSKINLTEENLLCGKMYSMKPAVSREQMKSGLLPSVFYSCCSGKHSGMLSICQTAGWDLTDYYREEHPVQQRMLETVAHMCSMKREDIGIGIDGCGVPVFSMPIYNMALGYARFARGTDPLYGSWCEELYDAMAGEPEMLAGTRGFCTDLTRAAGGRLVAKLGADGVYCIAVREHGIGIALKVESGDVRCIPPVIMDILHKLRLLSPDQTSDLQRYLALPNKNHLGDEIGSVLSTIQLKSYL